MEGAKPQILLLGAVLSMQTNGQQAGARVKISAQSGGGRIPQNMTGFGHSY